MPEDSREPGGSATSLVVEQLPQALAQCPESSLHLLQLGEERHGFLSVKGMGTRVEHGDGAPNGFEFRQPVHGHEHTFDMSGDARGRSEEVPGRLNFLSASALVLSGSE